MYKYKDKEFEVIEMTSPSNRLSWGTPFDLDQAEWRTFWGVSGEGNIQWIQEPPTINMFNLTRSRQGGIYEQISQQPTVNYTIEDLEEALGEIFYGQMERTRVSRSRRSGMSAMASAVGIQRTIGIP